MPNGAAKSDLTTQQKLRRTWRLIRVIALQFRVFFLWTTVAFFGSTLVLYNIYPVKELPPHHHSLLGIAYDTLQMIFFQAPIPFVDDWRLAPLFFGLPLLGLVVIAEGVVHLGNLLFQHRMYSREWQEMLAATFENHIIVCGLGNVGFRVVQRLRRMGEQVVCIERDSDSPFLAEMEKYDVPILIGDARNVQTLENASINKCKALIAVTNDDLANLEAALSARELLPNLRVVIRIFDQKLANKIEKSFGINCVFSTSALSAPVFAQSALSGNILASFEFGDTLVNAFQMVVASDSAVLGMTVDNVRAKFEVTVLMHQRNGQVDWNPPPDTKLNLGDKLLIITDNKSVHELLGSETQAFCNVQS
jgi:Trk K+ transport system NAD-binding subunit